MSDADRAVVMMLQDNAALIGKCERLQAENAKLRELVRTFYHCTTSGECDRCPVNSGGPVHLQPDTICDTIHDRMRELGVEV